MTKKSSFYSIELRDFKEAIQINDKLVLFKLGLSTDSYSNNVITTSKNVYFKLLFPNFRETVGLKLIFPVGKMFKSYKP